VCQDGTRRSLNVVTVPVFQVRQQAPLPVCWTAVDAREDGDVLDAADRLLLLVLDPKISGGGGRIRYRSVRASASAIRCYCGAFSHKLGADGCVQYLQRWLQHWLNAASWSAASQHGADPTIRCGPTMACRPQASPPPIQSQRSCPPTVVCKAIPAKSAILLQMSAGWNSLLSTKWDVNSEVRKRVEKGAANETWSQFIL
jgi:hypothetical protein